MTGRTPQQDARPALIFLHIPKAAGTTLYTILRREYSRQHTRMIDGGRVAAAVAEFKALPLAERAQVRLLMGHMPFGLHAFLPHPARYITLLRDPVERILSHYHFILRTPHHYLHQAVAGAGMSLHDYVTSGLTTEVDNGQTRLLAEVDAASDAPLPDMLQQAEMNLNAHFALAGLSEQFDESLCLMRRRLGWKHWPLYFKRNVTKDRPAGEQVTEATLSVIRQRNVYDSALYARVQRNFQQILAENAEIMENDMRRFSLMNRLYYYQTLPLQAAIRAKKQLGWRSSRAAR